jgi:hypothetical protein
MKDAMPAAMKDVMMRDHLWRCSLFQRRTAAGTTITILLTMVWVQLLPTLVQSGYLREEVTTQVFHLNTDTHADILSVVHQTAIAAAYPKLECRGHRFLGAKDYEALKYGGDGSPPGRWIRVPLRGETEDDRATIILSDSDLYLLAFENNEDTCYVFRGYENLFPGCLVMNPQGEDWDETYPGLLGKDNVIDKLINIPLGKEAELQSVRTLAHFRGITNSAIKIALAQNIIMFPEALRFLAIREQFSGERWETENKLTVVQARYVQYWAQISYFLWRWDREGTWPNNDDSRKLAKQTGITNAEQALAVVDLLRRPRLLRIGRAR